MIIKKAVDADLKKDMLASFSHREHITQKWVNENGNWVVRDADDIREWNTAKREWIPEYLRSQVQCGGAEKLFISAVSDVNTIAFYEALGCTDAAEIVLDFVDIEEDRCLEYVL